MLFRGSVIRDIISGVVFFFLDNRLCTFSKLAFNAYRNIISKVSENHCNFCGNRKANRFCPALTRLICSRCCGRNRQKSIDCPDNCNFLIVSRRQALKKLVNFQGDGEFEVAQFEVLHNLRLGLIKSRERARFTLTVEEVLSAINNAVETLRIRFSGLLYDFRSPNPNVQQTTEAILEIVQGHEKGDRGLKKVELSDILRCLQYIKRQIGAFQERGADFWGVIGDCVGRHFLAANLNLINNTTKI